MNNRFKIAYMGSPAFSAEILEHINKSQDVVCIYTMPNRRAGRGKQLTPTPVKQKAIELNIPNIFTSKPEEDKLRELGVDMIIVFAYSSILKKNILDFSRYGAINIHPSLLPKYRGSSPIRTSILNGDEFSGVTLMRMAERLDSGDIVLQNKIPIKDKNYSEVLSDMIEITKEMLNVFFDVAMKDELQYMPQDDELASYTKKIVKDDGRINWDSSAERIYFQSLALYDFPGCFTYIEDTRLKIKGIEISDEKSDSATPGTVTRISDMGINVSTRTNDIIIKNLQRPGRQMVPTREFLKGYNITTGTKLGGK